MKCPFLKKTIYNHFRKERFQEKLLHESEEQFKECIGRECKAFYTISSTDGKITSLGHCRRLD